MHGLPVTDAVLIVDFGGQFTQLIARRVREANVYSEIVPFHAAETAIAELKPKAIILSGGPASVLDVGAPQVPDAIFAAGVPVLGICYGQQGMVARLGGVVEPSSEREYGSALIDVKAASPLFDGVAAPGETAPVWMSHGDRVASLPEGFVSIATSRNAPYAAIADEERRLYGVQFHPEVVHTPGGAIMLRNFVHRIAGCGRSWTMAAFREAEIARLREQVGRSKVICGLSGGVDSAVTAVLLHEAIGDALTCIFVDHGLLRQGEAEEVESLFRGSYNIPLIQVKAAPTLPLRAQRRHRSRAEAQDHRPAVHRRLRRSGPSGRWCGVSRPGHPLSGRDRKRRAARRPFRHDQVASQRWRLARADEPEACRAPARAVQGRGPRARPRAWLARCVPEAAPLPGPGLAIRIPGAITTRSCACSARPTRSICRS